jgi:hypothetical protein
VVDDAAAAGEARKASVIREPPEPEADLPRSICPTALHAARSVG